MFREAELAHSRVAMMGTLGYLVQSHFAPMFAVDNAPVIRQLDQVLTTESGELIGSCLLMAVWFSEFARARIGWVEPEEEMRTLRENYAPGDLGFDPLNLKPEDPEEFRLMQEKELSHARLAMIAAAGFLAQEAVSGQTWGTYWGDASF